MRSLVVALGIIAPAAASALVAYGPDGPPTLDRLSRDARRVVLATVRIDSIGVVEPDTSNAPASPMSRLPLPFTRVVLLLERDIVPDSSAASDTLYSYMRGGLYLDELGRKHGTWVEDEPFSETRCDGRRCILFLDQATRRPAGMPAEHLYRPIDPFHAILPINTDGKVTGVPVKAEKISTIRLDKCIREIEKARRKQ